MHHHHATPNPPTQPPNLRCSGRWTNISCLLLENDRQTRGPHSQAAGNMAMVRISLGVSCVLANNRNGMAT
jgi:hypothetical protein